MNALRKEADIWAGFSLLCANCGPFGPKAQQR
jgi:hypothetical protein